MPLGAENRVVRTDVEVIGGRVEGQLILCRNPGEIVRLGGCGDLNGAELARFLGCVACKVAGDGIIRLAGDHQVERNGGEHHGRAALHEQDLVVVRDIEHAAQNVLCAVDNVVIIFGSVTHLHDGHAGALIVEHLCCGFFQNRQRHHGRTCRKVVNSSI